MFNGTFNKLNDLERERKKKEMAILAFTVPDAPFRLHLGFEHCNAFSQSDKKENKKITNPIREISKYIRKIGIERREAFRTPLKNIISGKN